MDRRACVSILIVGLLGALLAAEAQSAVKAYRVGVLGAGTAAQYAQRMDWFRQELRQLGWLNERAITFEERWADERYERLPGFAAELVALKVDVIFVTGGSPVIEAAIKATREIPIVFSAAGDPVAQGMVPSMAHPAGNATGLSLMSGELYSKRLELLKEAVPGLKRVGLLINGANSFAAEALRSSQAASQSLGIELKTFDVRGPENLASTFEMMSRAGVQGVIVGADSMLSAHLKQVGALALKHRIPLTANSDGPGVLIAYYRDNEAMYRRAAVYVDKILRGAKAADLPIEQPSRLDLIVNLKTAKSLGITIPQSLLLRADEVIQ